MTTKVMVVEDEGLFRDMLRVSLDGQRGFQIVGMAADGATAVRLARDLEPDVVLMDIELGSRPNGIEAGIRIKEENPGIGIVVLSNHREKEYLANIPPAQLGGWSYLMKRSVGDLSALARAVEGAAAGFTVLDSALVSALGPRKGSRLASLTPRQRQVLELVAEGYNNAGIAKKLFLEERTVENHINAIYGELQITREDLAHPRVRAVLTYLQESQAFGG